MKKNSDLYYAIRRKDIKLASWLIEHQADLYTPDEHGDTPFICAVRYQCPEIVVLLLKKGIAATEKDKDDMTALSIAIANFDEETVRILLENGADPNQETFKGKPLIFALLKDNRYKNIVKELVRAGINIRLKNKAGLTPLALLTAEEDVDLAEEFIRHKADVNVTGPEGEPLLIQALTDQHSVLARLLLEHGADPNTCSADGIPALGQSIRQELPELARLLVSLGANLATRDSEGYWPLELAIKYQDDELVLLMVQQGADLLASGQDQLPLIILALDYGTHKVCDWLVEQKINMAPVHKTPGGKSYSLLHAAAYAGHIKLVNYFLQTGADINMLDNKGYTPVAAAVIAGQNELVRFLLNNGAQKQGLMPLVTQAMQPETIKLLHEYQVDVNEKDPDGHTALYLAATLGWDEGTQELIRAGVKIKKDELKPLFTTACASGATSLIEYLVSKGADINEELFDHETPLLLFIRKNNLTGVERLIACGADVNTGNAKGETPLSVAIASGHLELTRLLLAKGADIRQTVKNNESKEISYLELALKTAGQGIVLLLLEKDYAFFSSLPDFKQAVSTIIRYGYETVFTFLNEKGLIKKLDSAFLNELFMENNFDWLAEALSSELKLPKSDKAKGELFINAICYGREELAVRLLAAAPELAQQVYAGKQTPLHLAVKYNRCQVAAALLKVGANVNAMDHEGRTPVCWVIDPEMFDLLIKNKADLNLLTTAGQPVTRCIRNQRLVGDTST